MSELFNKIYNTDCLELCKRLPDKSVNLIVTSPPYADQRKNTYGGIDPDQYVEWFLPISSELKRVLADDGSCIVNIKEKVVNGERHIYVMELIIAMRRQGWLFTEEYIWHKRSSAPGKWPNRFRDAWERCIHFTKHRKFKMFQDKVKVPIGDWAASRMKKLSVNDKLRNSSMTRSGFGKKIQNWEGKDTVFPNNILSIEPDNDYEIPIVVFGENGAESTYETTNVVHLPAECGNVKHPAAYPLALPEWFIKLFSQNDDIVFDPFLGSGTTLIAAKKLGRQFIGSEIHPDYYEISKKRIFGEPFIEKLNEYFSIDSAMLD